MSERVVPDASSLNVLMISLGDEVLTGWGDTRERHLEYAERIRHLHMVGYSPRRRDLHQTALSDHLTFYPTRSATRPGFIWDAYRIGTRICRQHHIDVITTQDPFTTGLSGALLKWRFRIPLDLQNHSDFFDNRYWISERPVRYGLLNILGKWVIRFGDTHRVLNEIEKSKYLAMGIPAEQVAVLATPVRLSRFTPEEASGEQAALRASLNIPPEAPVLLWVGKPGWVKRISLLVDSFAQVHQEHPGVHLVLVGNFDPQPEIRAQVDRFGLSDFVHFPGKIAHDDLPAYYRLCTLYVHSSIYEGLGKVLIEAAASGKPSVSTRTAGAQAIIVDRKTGLLCDLESPSDMASKISRLLSDPACAAEMGRAARAYVLDKFDHARNLDEVIQTWERTAAFRRGRS
jgi:glycosyltransferase involved in cell wall biosynthesis